jgi:hypothetical protein
VSGCIEIREAETTEGSKVCVGRVLAEEKVVRRGVTDDS